MYAPNNKYYRFNPMTESLLFLFYKKDKFMFSYTFLHFISRPFFLHFFTIVIFCHFELKSAEIKAHVFEIHANYLNKRICYTSLITCILTSITQRSLDKYTVSPGHSLIAHHRKAVDRDADKNGDF